MKPKTFLNETNTKVAKKAREEFDKKCNDWWESLSPEEKEQAFYSVSKRIHQADIIDQGSYRYALYEVFGFQMESYIVGLWSGYMDIHNMIYNGLYHERKNKKEV